MLVLKKITPLEFRISSQKLVIPFSVENYFENFRFQLLFSRLFFWFFKYFGFYFFIRYLRRFNNSLILHFFYYRVYNYKKFLTIFNKKSLFFYLSGFYNNKAAVKIFKPIKFFNGSGMYEYFSNYQKSITKKLINFKKIKNFVSTNISFKFFFFYYFFYFFGLRSVILFKSLYKTFYSVKLLKDEQNILFEQVKYVQQMPWGFDFTFFFHYMVTFADSLILLPFYIFHIKTEYKQQKRINHFFYILNFWYNTKENFKGVKIIVHGPFNRHGRTQIFLWSAGTLVFTRYDSLFLYDTIQWPTFYGMTQLRFWIQFAQYKLLVWNYLDRLY